MAFPPPSAKDEQGRAFAMRCFGIYFYEKEVSMASQPNIPPTPPESDAAHVPMTEEFDSFKHTMPNAVPIAVAMLLVVVVLGILAYVFRYKPVAAGTIDDAFAVTVPSQNNSLAIVDVSFRNVSDKPLRLTNVTVGVHAKGADFSDDFGSASDYPRYFQAFPALQQHAQPGLTRDLKLAPGEKATGSAIVALPLTQEEFAARDSMTVTLHFDNQRPVKIVSGKK
jgi:hypothetical protein